MNTTNQTKVQTVKAGDRLPLIAAEVYGDPRNWRVIAEANGIDDPLNFPKPEDIGRMIVVP